MGKRNGEDIHVTRSYREMIQLNRTQATKKKEETYLNVSAVFVFIRTISVTHYLYWNV